MPLHQQLIDDVTRANYYPAVVLDDLERAVGDEAVLAHVALTDVYMDHKLDVQRDLTVHLLTASRVIVWTAHEDGADPDEQDVLSVADEPAGEPKTWTLHAQTQQVRLSTIVDTRLVTGVENPAAYSQGDVPDSAAFYMVLSHVDAFAFEQAHCSDEDCEASHGSIGELSHDSLSITATKASYGQDGVRQVLAFAEAVGFEQARR